MSRWEMESVKSVVSVNGDAVTRSWSVSIRERGGKKKEGLHVSGDVKLGMDRVHTTRVYKVKKLLLLSMS